MKLPGPIFRTLAPAVLVGLLFAATGAAALSHLGGTGIVASSLPGDTFTSAQTKDKAKKAETAPASATLLGEDQGKFRILLDGRQVGTEEFQISPEAAGAKEWTARGTTEISLPEGGAAHITGRLKLASDGTPLRYEWSTHGQRKASAVVEFQGGRAKISLQLEGRQPYVQELSFNSPRIVILDNNLYHHYAVLARIYDWNARGPQTFPVLIPQDMTPGEITVEALGPQDMEGVKLQVLRVQTADLEVQLFVDTSHRLVRLAVPASKALILRE